MRLLVAHPGAHWATADVYDGLSYGLKQHGVQVIPFRLDQRIPSSHKWLHVIWRQKSKQQPKLAKPNTADVIYHASLGILEMALRKQVDAVIVVTAMMLHPDVLILMRRAGLRVTVLFTESPYDLEQELKVAALVDGCWTNERSVVADFRRVNPCAGYLPHAWHPQKHFVAPGDDRVPRHDVLFIGTGFPERVGWFHAIDWTGIDLGIYGTWDGRGMRSLKPYVKGEQVDNDLASQLYRRAKICLNLYRTSKHWGEDGRRITHAESLNPRAYELAACGVFHLSEYREEVRERFGDLVPTFATPPEAAALMRRYLADDSARQSIAQQLPATVSDASWVTRARTVIGDLQRLLGQRAA